MSDYRHFRISGRANPDGPGYTVTVFNAINMRVKLPELYEDGKPKVFGEFGVAMDTAKRAIDRELSTPMAPVDPELAREGLHQIVNKQAKELADLRVKLAKSQAESTNRYAALHLYINWTDIIVAERDERIAELEARVVNLLAWVEHLENDNQLDAAAAQLYAIDKEKAMQALEGEVK